MINDIDNNPIIILTQECDILLYNEFKQAKRVKPPYITQIPHRIILTAICYPLVSFLEL